MLEVFFVQISPVKYFSHKGFEFSTKFSADPAVKEEVERRVKDQEDVVEMGHTDQVRGHAVSTMPVKNNALNFMIAKKDILVAEEKYFKGDMIFDEVDFDDFERQSEALADDEEDDNGSEHQSAFLPLSL